MTLDDYQSGRVAPIDVFEGQIKEWILALAEHLAHERGGRNDAGIAVLMLTCSVLEPLGGVLPLPKGRRTSEAKFCNGFVRVFPEVSGSEDAWRVAEQVCDLLRNGLFHEAFVKCGVALTVEHDAAVMQKDDVIYINPFRFLDSVAAAFDTVCEEIRSAEPTAPICQAFDVYWAHRETEHALKRESIGTPEKASCACLLHEHASTERFVLPVQEAVTHCGDTGARMGSGRERTK